MIPYQVQACSLQTLQRSCTGIKLHGFQIWMAEFRNRNESVACAENIPGLGETEDEETVKAAVVPKIDANLLSRAHFYFGRTLGEGSYARVVHARMKLENSPDYAIKIMEKAFIQKEKKVCR